MLAIKKPTFYLHNWEEDFECDPIVGPLLVDQLLHLALSGVLTQGTQHLTHLLHLHQQENRLHKGTHHLTHLLHLGPLVSKSRKH